jgi:hypothetical protein
VVSHGVAIGLAAVTSMVGMGGQLVAWRHLWSWCQPIKPQFIVGRTTALVDLGARR